MDVPQQSTCRTPEAHGPQEEVQDVKPTVTSGTGGPGGEAEAAEKMKREDELEAGEGPGAGAGEGPGAGAGEGPGAGAGEGLGAGAAGADAGTSTLAAMRDDGEPGSPQASGGRDEENPGQPEQEPEEELSSLEAQGSLLPDAARLALCRTVSELRLHEVERIFLRTPYPEMLVREEPPVPPSATEAENQNPAKQ